MKNIDILFENESFLVLNKPPGLPVQGGKGVAVSLDSLLSAFRDPRPLLVHRLDKDTSGLIITAKTREAAAACSSLFVRGGLEKRYLALCAGNPGPEGKIREKLPVRGRELEAKTAYKKIGGSRDFSLVELAPATGRMHQIRRHMAGLGCPILGDDKYGDFALNKRLRKDMGLKRLLLHAASIRLPESLVPEKPLIAAPLPAYFRDFLEKAGIPAGSLPASY